MALAPHPLKLKSATDDHETIKNTTSAAGAPRHVVVVVVDAATRCHDTNVACVSSASEHYSEQERLL